MLINKKLYLFSVAVACAVNNFILTTSFIGVLKVNNKDVDTSEACLTL